MSDERIAVLEDELRNAVGRIVLLESAFGTFASNLLSPDVVSQLIAHLEIVHSDLGKLGLPPVQSSILTTLKNGKGKGPSATLGHQ